MDTTRRQFIDMLGAATAIGSTTAFAKAKGSDFIDIDPSESYVLHNQAMDCQHEERCLSGRRWIDLLNETCHEVEEAGFLDCAFRKTRNDEWVFIPENEQTSKIEVSEAWLHEFWRRHKGD